MSDKNVNLPVAPEQENFPRFKGYTIDEIRYQIVLKSLQREFCKDKLVNNFKKTVSATPFGSGSNGKTMRGGSLLSSIMKGLSFADYFLVGFSAFRTVKKIFSVFRRKKK